MESYGEILKKTREEKHLDFETIARETSIAKNYLEALERDSPESFPGEPYFIGFLKNYAEYLGVDKERLITLYHARKLQETPPPAALTMRERPRWVVPLIVTLSILAFFGLAAASCFYIRKIYLEKEALKNAVSVDKSFKKYTLTDDPFEGRLFKTDQLILKKPEGEICLTVIETSGIFGIEVPAGRRYIELSEEADIDVDDDGIPELIVYVSDVSSNNVDRGAEVKIMLKDGNAIPEPETEEDEVADIDSLPKDKPYTELFSDNRPYPFVLNASFKAGYGCLLRYRSDRKDIIDDYYESGRTLSITSSNGIRVWISNGNVAKLSVVANSRTYELGSNGYLGKAGEVVVVDVKWIKDTDGKFKLVVVNLD